MRVCYCDLHIIVTIIIYSLIIFTMSLCLAFTGSILATGSVIGMYGAFAVIKDPLSNSLHLTKSFLGQ